MKRIGVFALLAFLLGSCGATKAVKNDSVKQFLNRFDKQKFILQIEEQKVAYENAVRMMQPMDSERTFAAKAAYEKTHAAYNRVLDDMANDISKITNIVNFKLFDARNKYARELDEATKLGNNFMFEAGKTLNEPEMGVNPIFSFIVDSIYPIIKKVHDKYLSYCKMQVQLKLHETKLRSWGEIMND